jgi:hypothetical protein
MKVSGILKGLKKGLARLTDMLLEFMLFILWLLLFLLWHRKFNKPRPYSHKSIHDTPDCLKCPLHCPHTPQGIMKPSEEKQTVLRSSSHPVNLPVPPLRSRSGKPTKLQIAREKLQRELNKPSGQINITLVKELQKKIEELEDKWRKKSKTSKRARKRKKQSITKETPRKPVRVRKPPSFPTASKKPPKTLTKSKSQKLTRLQSVCNLLNKELARPSKHVNINRLKELEKKKERLQQEWHNRSRAQKQAWRWRKKTAEALRQKAIKDSVQYPEASNKQAGLSGLDKRTCLRCPIHCFPVQNIQKHWKNKLYHFLSTILRQPNAKKAQEDSKGASIWYISGSENINERFSEVSFIQKAVRWIQRRCALRYLVQKIEDACGEVCYWIMRLIERGMF